MRWLPAANLVSSHIHYFHTAPLLECHLHLDGHNPLLLDHETEGVLARYRDRRGAWTVLVVRYPTSPRAAQARQRFAASCLPDRHDEVQRLDDGAWLGLVLRGPVLAGVVGAPSRACAERSLAAIDPKRAEVSQ